MTDRELAARLSWFISIRWFAGLATVLFLAAAWLAFGIRFPIGPVLAAVAALFAYNAVLHFWVRRERGLGRLRLRTIYVIANVQVICDLVCVAFIWHYAGAVENVFGIFFIFPMVWASELLHRRNAYLCAMLGSTLINAVVWGEYTGRLSHVHLMRLADGLATGGAARLEDFVPVGLHTDWAFVFMVAFTLSGALFVTVFLAATVADRLRVREEQLEEAYRGLQSLDEMKSHFMRKASHELRAPLAAIHTMLQTVTLGLTGQVDGRQLEMIQRARGRTDSLMELINDLLRYSRLEAEAGIAVPRRPVPLGEVAQRTVELLRPSAEAKGIRIESRLEPAVIMADEEGLTELVTNLVSNAIRYSPAGAVVEISLATSGGQAGGGRPADAQAELRVADHGIGIAAEDATFIFQEFFRSEAAKKAVQHGTGMGLAIAKRLVESYRGTIDFESRPGQGTTFRVRLPLAEEEGVAAR